MQLKFPNSVQNLKLGKPGNTTLRGRQRPAGSTLEEQRGAAALQCPGLRKGPLKKSVTCTNSVFLKCFKNLSTKEAINDLYLLFSRTKT